MKENLGYSENFRWVKSVDGGYDSFLINENGVHHVRFESSDDGVKITKIERMEED